MNEAGSLGVEFDSLHALQLLNGNPFNLLVPNYKSAEVLEDVPVSCSVHQVFLIVLVVLEFEEEFAKHLNLSFEGVE